MLLLEPLARPLLVLHAVSAGVLVGAATHHVLLCRRYLSGQPPRVPLDRRYVLVTACAYALTFAIGLFEYPTYKVRVRAEYLDAPLAVAAEAALREQGASRTGSPAPPERGRDLAWVGRLFDVKEHWAALGLAAAVALLVLSRTAHPSEDARFAAVYVGLSAFVCTAAWLAALVGLVTAGYRAVGAAS